MLREISCTFQFFAFRHEHDNPSGAGCIGVGIVEKFGLSDVNFRARCKSLNFIGHRIFLCAFYRFYERNFYEAKKKWRKIIKTRNDGIKWKSKLFNWIRFPSESKLKCTLPKIVSFLGVFDALSRAHFGRTGQDGIRILSFWKLILDFSCISNFLDGNKIVNQAAAEL